MRKIYSIFAIAVSALFVSCAKEDVPTPDPVPGKIEMVPVTVSVSLGGDTKATIHDMKWEAGDKITVWVASALSDDTYTGDVLDITNVETGTFSGQIRKPQASDTYYTAYQSSGFDKVNKKPIFNIPAEQNGAKDGATKVMLEGASFTGSKYEFEHRNLVFTAATAKLQINVDMPVTGVEFAGMNDETLTGSSKTISYSGTAANDIELVVPAMTFSNGYKVTYTNASGKKMYQSYSSGKSVAFTAGHERKISCTFVPFEISCAVDAANAPKTSYDYYLAGDIAAANAEKFETVGRLSGGSSENPWQYDEDAQGIFTGKIERGKAKVIINGASSAAIPSNIKIKEYGCYVKRVDGAEGKDIYATGQSITLTKDFSWDVLYKSGEAATHMLEVDAGDLEIKPYIVVNDGAADAEYVAPTAYTLHVTGLPHRSDHKDLWYVCSTGSGANQVSGKVERHNDEANYPVDMFRQNDRNGWEDYCVRTRYFNIPAETRAQVIMHGTLWAPHSINAYFWFDATKDSFVFHKNVDRTGASGEKLKNLSDCDAYDEESEARQHTSYFDLGTTHGHVNDNTITLSPANPAASVYLWIHRGTTVATDYVGYWCRYIKVQYAAPGN